MVVSDLLRRVKLLPGTDEFQVRARPWRPTEEDGRKTASCSSPPGTGKGMHWQRRAPTFTSLDWVSLTRIDDALAIVSIRGRRARRRMEVQT